jgi:hypothetical protein
VSSSHGHLLVSNRTRPVLAHPAARSDLACELMQGLWGEYAADVDPCRIVYRRLLGRHADWTRI